MKIGIVTNWFNGGTGNVSKAYRQVLSLEHDVFIYAHGDENFAWENVKKFRTDPDWNDPSVTRGKNPTMIATFIDLKSFERWLDQNKIAIVIFNEQWWWPAVTFCQRKGVKTGTYVDYYNELTLPLFDCYDFLLCNTRRHYSAMEWHPNCLYIPWGTDVNIYKPSTFDAVDPGKVTFYHSSHYAPQRKGTDLVIKAFSFLPDSALLVIQITGDLKAAYPELRSVIDQLESQKRLRIITSIVEAPGLYHLGDVYVYPTRLEGIGLTIAEAISCGLPVITTDNPPMNEFVKHDVNGRLVAVDRLVARVDGYYWPQSYPSVESLRKQMKFYVEHAGEIGELKRRARLYAEQYLDWGKNSAALSSTLQTIKKRPLSELNKALLAAEEYERQHAPLYQRYPKLYATLRFGNRILKKLKVRK